MSYMITRFPKDTLGSLGNNGTEGIEIEMKDSDEALHKVATDLIEHCKNISDNLSDQDITKFNNLFGSFVRLFNIWKQDDSEKLKNSLIQEYHQLSVNIMNEKATINELNQEGSELNEQQIQHNELTRQRIEVIEECKESLLDTARMLGGPDLVDLINQYSPVVIDLEELCKQYGNAFWDLLGDEYREKGYDKIFVVLENILQLFSTLYDNERCKDELTEIKEKIDVQFIKQRLEHGTYSNEEMYALCQFILSHMKKLVAANFDENLSILEQNIQDPNFLPIFLRETTMILQITTTDTLNLRKAAAQSESTE